MKYKSLFKLSWKPDIPDFRDYTFSQIKTDRSTTRALPTACNLRKWCSEVEDQQYLGSCVANSIVGMLEFKRNYKKLTNLNFSRLFLYYNVRIIEDSVDEDSGAYIRNGFKSLNMNGICTADQWPYDLRKWKTKPPKSSYLDALDFTISRYYRLNTIEEMKTSLANGHPFVFGFAVYTSFVSSQVANTGIVPMPLQSENMLGGHAVMAIGYDDVTQRFLIRNSWGKNWGIRDGNLQGYFTMPYEYLANRNLSDDFWTIR